MEAYKTIVLGGTFDRIHKGHEALLKKAFQVGESVVIGLTSDAYVRNVKDPFGSLHIQSYDKRRKHITEWLTVHGYERRTTIVPIDDFVGMTVPKKGSQHKVFDFEAIVVSSETKGKAEKINMLREGKGLKKLDIVEVPILSAEDGLPISSTRIKLDQIDTEGKLVLPVYEREKFSRPLGRVLNELEATRAIKEDKEAIHITVGDQTTFRILTIGLLPHLAVIDLSVKRKPFFWDKKLFDRLCMNTFVVELASGPGYISNQAMVTIREWSMHPEKRTTILVDGEEDLLALPAMLYGPIGSVLYYGQPALRKRGCSKRTSSGSDGLVLANSLVRVVIDRQKKSEALRLLDTLKVT